MSPESHALPDCPLWCAARAGEPHDVDDTYGLPGVHHDSALARVELVGGGYLYVRLSQLQPLVGTRWPVMVEVEAELQPSRRRSGLNSLWLYSDEAGRLI